LGRRQLGRKQPKDRLQTTDEGDIQGCTFQDEELGRLKKLPNEQYWIVYRKAVAEKWCLLFGKTAWPEHVSGEKHVRRVGNADSWLEHNILGLRSQGLRAPRRQRTSAR
jgi:hypothetical protein